MMRIHCWIGLLVGLVATCVAAPPAAGQALRRDGVVIVTTEGTDVGTLGQPMLGFITGEVDDETRVLTYLDDDASGSELMVAMHDRSVSYRARQVDRHATTGLAVLGVPRLSVQGYALAQGFAAEDDRVHGAALAGGSIRFEPGYVVTVEPLSDVSRGFVRHDAYVRRDQLPGAPLLNDCADVVGVAYTELPADGPSPVKGLSLHIEWIRTTFGDNLGAGFPSLCRADSIPDSVSVPSPPVSDPPPVDPPPVDPLPASDPPQVPAPAPAPDPTAVASAAENALGLNREDRRLIQLGLASLGFNPGEPDGLFGDATREAVRRAQAARSVAVTGYLDAGLARDLRQFGESLTEEQQRRLEAEQREAEEARLREEAEQREAEEARLREEAEQREAEEARLRGEAQRQARVRLVLWTGGAVVGGTLLAVLFWVFSRRSVADATRGRDKAEMLARSAHADLAERDAQERMASAVPAVFLDGNDAAGEPVAVRVPGNAIAAAGGAIVGRNPFDSTVVLDHVEVSRGHFRLFARGTSVMVEDLNSTNGTKVNGAPLTPGAGVPLDQGAVLQVGSVTLNVTLQA